MSDNVSMLTQADFKRSGGGFSFTGKLAELVRNSDWVNGYEAVKSGESSKRNGHSSLWECISAGAEDTGNELYVSIRNYVDNIGNIDTCGLDALKNYADELKIEDDMIDLNFEFPLEIKKLVEIFSVNTAYLFSKETDGDKDTLASDNTILHYTTIEKIIDSLKSRDKYMSLMRDTYYNTLMKFIELNVSDTCGSISDMEPTERIWKLNINRMTDRLWDDDVESEADIYKLKTQLDVDKSFAEKLYADDIIAGKRSLRDFTANEQSVIKAEMLSRETRYGNDGVLRYYYMRLYKVLEYIRFTTIAYRNAYDLGGYDISTTKFVVTDKTSDSDTVLKFRNGEYSVDTSLVTRVAEWLADYSLELCNIRTRMKRQCQKNMMCGTKKVIVDLIREYILEKIDSDTWKNIRNTTLFKSKLNKNFDISVVEYIDPTEYYNIRNGGDIVDAEEYGMHGRYWESNYDAGGILDNDDIRKFYNTLTESRDTFVTNSASGIDCGPNLYEFLSDVFAMGATSDSIDAFNVEGIVYDAVESTAVTAVGTVGGDNADIGGPLYKFTGNAELGTAPYANEKNEYHPSYQSHPFLRAFEEYTYAYTGIMNLVNSFSVDIEESRHRLDRRIDELGNTINFWLNWNEDFTGYSSYYEKSGDDVNSKFFQDSPFNFDALNEYVNSDAFIATVLTRTNPYYIDDRTGNFILDDEEVDLEVMRLKKYRNSVKMLKEREIYRYGRDNYGNIYVLYKEKGKRKDKNALGDMWVRLKNHPIAFPMFEFNRTQNSFSKLSVVRNSDNAYLMSLISNSLIRYNPTYGGNDGSKVVNEGISFSVATNDVNGILTSDGNGGYTELEPLSNYSAYTQDNTIYTLVKKNKALTKGIDYTYYIDSGTGSVVTGAKIYKNDDTEECQSSDVKPIEAVNETMFRATFSNGIGRIYSTIGNLAFVSYTMSVDTDPDTYYYYIADGVKHAVSKHSVHINGEPDGFTNFTEFSGNYASNGDFTVGNIGTDNTITHETCSISALGIVQTVDGNLIREEFHNYSPSAYEVSDGYGYPQSDIYRINNSLHGGDEIDGVIARVGGNNPVFAEILYDTSRMEYPTWRAGERYDVGSKSSRVSSDDMEYAYTCRIPNSDTEFDSSKWTLNGPHDERDSALRTTVGIRPYMLKERSGNEQTRRFSLSSDAYYHPNPSAYSLEPIEFELSSVEFVANSGYSDTIRPFYNSSKSNIYYPYTTITKVVTSPSDTAVTSVGGPLQTFNVNGINCYYKILTTGEDTPTVSGYNIDSNVLHSNVSTTLYKMHGGFSMYESTVDDTPISLTFSDIDGISNVMTYSSLFSPSNQKKFNDFGFSHDQNVMYLNCSDSTDGKYIRTGTIFGKISENVSDGVTDRISFMHNNSKNLEFVACSKRSKFHIGEATNKNGTFCAYGNVETANGVDTLSVILYTFANNDVFVDEYRTTLKYRLYNLATDGGTDYGFKCVATDDRMYIAFTCHTPSDSELLSNTVNGMSTGTVGTAVFSNISRYCGDSLVTILSFDITDIDDITLNDDEVRYIMENGALGYFPQYSGVLGKNIIFNNTQLNNDVRYPFYAQFDEYGTSPVTGELTRTISVHGKGADGNDFNYGSFGIERFIDTYDSFDNGNGGHIRGFAIDDSESPRAFYVDIDMQSDSGSFCLTGNSSVGTYDVSRAVQSDTEHGVVHIKATADNNASYVHAFLCDGDCSSIADVRELLCTDIAYPIRTDFTEFFELSGSAYAFHADGSTVSRLIVEPFDTAPLEKGVCAYYNRPSTFTTFDSGFDCCKENTDGGCAFTHKSTANDTTSYRAYHVYENSIGSHELTGLTDGEIPEYKSAFAMFVDGTNGRIPCAVAISSGGFDVYGFGEDGTCGIVHREEVPSLANININSFATTNSNGMLLFTASNSQSSLAISITPRSTDGTIEIGTHFNKDVYSKATSSTNIEAFASNCGNYTVFSVNADGNGTLLYVDSNLTFSGSVGELSRIYSTDGVEEMTRPTSVGRCYVMRGIIAADCDGNTGVLVSTDGGLTFRRQIDAQGRGVKIIGVGKDRFFGKDVNNGSLLHSFDGNLWTCDGTALPSEWGVTSDGNESYFVCKTQCDGGYDLNHRVRICSQTTVMSNYGYDSMCVSDSGDIVLYGGLDGNSPLRYARSEFVDGMPVGGEKSNRSYQSAEFDGVYGKEYATAYIFGNDLFFAPKYSSTVGKISNVIAFDKTPSVSYIDISDTLMNSAVTFEGFTTVNDTLVMYPSDGSIILAYSDDSNKFFNYYTDKGAMRFGDADPVGKRPINEILFTPLQSNGSEMKFVCTKFHNRNDFGLVELDNGYPIMVKYESITDPMYGGLYQFTFTFLNDSKRNYVTVFTSPSGYDGGFAAFAAERPEKVRSSGVYTVGGEVITYTFATVDETTKYCIYRNVVGVEVTLPYDAFSITYDLNSSRRWVNTVTYRTCESGDDRYVSILDGFNGFNPASPEETPYIMKLDNSPNAAKSAVITPFQRYSYADTAVFKGTFESLQPHLGLLNHVLDSNLRFDTLSSQFHTAENMFSGCKNASFNNSLTIAGNNTTDYVNITSTANMFKGCINASLPKVNIASIYINGSVEGMFYGCANASLEGATVPPNAKYASDMFSGCSKARLMEVTEIPDSVSSMSGMFNMCTAASFDKFTFGNMTFEAPQQQ